MGKRFHKNSVYVLILRSTILIMDLLGLNLILGLLLWMFNFKGSNLNHEFTIPLVHLVLSITWFIPSMYFKTYEGNLKIAYNLKNSIYQFFVHLFILITISKILQTDFFNYIIFSYYSIFSITFLPFSRYAIAFYLNKFDNIIPIRKRVTIIGSKPLITQLQGFLEAEHSGYRLLKLNIPKNEHESDYNYLVMTIAKAKENNISHIYSFINLENEAEINSIISLSENAFIRFRFIKENLNQYSKSIIINKESDIPVIGNHKNPLEELDNRIRKRLLDIIFSFLVIVFFLSWLLPILGILIRLESKGPILFKQKRTGRNNQPFICYKFRTMVLNASSDIEQAAPNDYRFTKIGKFLRQTNLDELPQFINVIKGEMSIIGPRPHMLNHTSQYEEIVASYTKRHFIKPGISGWAQINGLRGNLDKKMMEVRVQYDLEYIRNWNFWVDLDIIIRTIVLTITGDENAY